MAARGIRNRPASLRPVDRDGCAGRAGCASAFSGLSGMASGLISGRTGNRIDDEPESASSSPRLLRRIGLGPRAASAARIRAATSAARAASASCLAASGVPAFGGAGAAAALVAGFFGSGKRGGRCLALARSAKLFFFSLGGFGLRCGAGWRRCSPKRRLTGPKPTGISSRVASGSHGSGTRY